MNDDRDHGVGWGVFVWGAVMLVFWIGVFLWWKWS